MNDFRYMVRLEKLLFSSKQRRLRGDLLALHMIMTGFSPLMEGPQTISVESVLLKRYKGEERIYFNIEGN